MSLFINCYQTLTGPHYSRPHARREDAEAARVWFEEFSQTTKAGPHRFTGSVRVKLKDPALVNFLNGGPTLFSAPDGEREKTPPENYVNATALNGSGCRTWPNFWRAKSVKARASALAAQLGVPVSELVITRTGGDVSKQGTWVHPAIAEQFKAWLGVGAEQQEAVNGEISQAA